MAPFEIAMWFGCFDTPWASKVITYSSIKKCRHSFGQDCKEQSLYSIPYQIDSQQLSVL